jgi:hypothetical protein
MICEERAFGRRETFYNRLGTAGCANVVWDEQLGGFLA